MGKLLFACVVFISAMATLAASAQLATTDAPTPIEPLDEMESNEAFRDYFAPYPLGIVFYTTVNCPECIELQLRLRASVAAIRTQLNVTVPIAKITFDRNDITVRGLYYDAPHHGPDTPSLEVVRFGELQKGRWRARPDTVDAIVHYLGELLQPPYVNVTSVGALSELVPTPQGFAENAALRGNLISTARIVVVGYFSQAHIANEPALWHEFLHTIEWYRERAVTIAVITHTQVAAQYGAPAHQASIAVYHEATPNTVDWFQPAVSSLEVFLTSKARPYIQTMHDEPLHDPHHTVAAFVSLFLQTNGDDDGPPSDDNGACMDQLIKLVAIPLRRGLRPVEQYAVSVQPFTKRVGEHFHMRAGSSDDIPQRAFDGSCEGHVHVIMMDRGTGKPYYFGRPLLLSQSPRHLVTIIDFVNTARLGKGQIALRSQPASLTDLSRIGGSGKVITVVGYTFDKVLQRLETLSFVGLISARCGAACDEARAILRDVAYLLRDDPLVVIATIDQDANDMPPRFRRDDSPSFFTIPMHVAGVCEWYDGQISFEAIYQHVFGLTVNFDPNAPVPARPTHLGTPDSNSNTPRTDEFDEDEPRDPRLQRAAEWKGPTWQKRARR